MFIISLGGWVLQLYYSTSYRDIFTYFDAPLVGLTATPKEDIDKNTYENYELPKGKEKKN